MIQAVFIDRDGTIGGGDQVVLPGEFELYPFVKDSFHLLRQSGIKLLSFTNQPCIAKGEATKDLFEKELISFGFDHIYLCPHKHDEGCSCRKPSSGMLIQAANELKLDLKKCAVIGDRWTDLIAATNVGCLKILVKTGAGNETLKKFLNNQFYGEWAEVAPDYIAENLHDAVSWLIKR